MTAGIFTYAIIGVLFLTTLVSLSYCLRQISKVRWACDKALGTLHCDEETIQAVKAEVDSLKQKVTPMALTLDSMQVRRFGDVSSVPFLKMRHGTTGMAKLHNNSGKLVASLSEAFLYSAMGVKPEEFGKYEVEIRLKRITGTVTRKPDCHE